MCRELINKIKLFKAVVPVKNKISDATHTLEEVSFLVLRITTKSGVTGEGYLLCFQYSPYAIVGAVKDFMELVKTYSIWETGKFNIEALIEDEYFGHTGLLNWARCLFNIAM